MISRTRGALLLVIVAMAAVAFISLCENPQDLVAEETNDQIGALTELQDSQAMHSAEVGAVALVHERDAENQLNESNQAAKAADDASVDEERFKEELDSANAALAEANANPETFADIASVDPVDVSAAALPPETKKPAAIPAAPAVNSTDVTQEHYPFSSSVVAVTDEEPTKPRCFCLPPQSCFCANPPDAATRKAWKETHPLIKPKPKPKPQDVQAEQLHHIVAHLNHTMARVATHIASLAKLSPKAAEKLHETQDAVAAIASVPGADPVAQALEAERAEAEAKDEIAREDAVNNMRYMAGVGVTKAQAAIHLKGKEAATNF